MTESKSSIPNEESFLKRFLPIAILALLDKGLIDKNKLADKEYVVQIINENPDVVKELRVILTMQDNFIKSAQEAIDAKRPEVAVVLIATTIEHTINMFYRDALAEQSLLSTEEITELIRSNNYNAKIGWLLTIITKNEIDADIRKNVAKIMEIRNQIVHYKAVPTSISSKHPIKKSIEEFRLNDMLITLDVLSETLDDILENVRNESPEYNLVSEAIKSLME